MKKENFAGSNPITTSLPAYVEQNTELMISSSILTGKTADLFTLQTGVKGPTAINILKSDTKFQNGKSCGFKADGTHTMTQRQIVPGIIKVNEEYCPSNLLGKYAQNQVRIAAGKDVLPFEAEFMKSVNDGIKENLEAALWLGDTGSGDTNLKQFDGIIKIMENEGTVKDVAITNETSKFEAVRSVLAAIPAKVIKEDTVIFCSPEFLSAYMQELVDKNLYHFAPAEDFDTITIPGSSVKLVAVAGLSGAAAVKEGKTYLVAGRLSNFIYGTDLEGDEEQYDLWFSKDNDVFRLKVRFVAGTNIAFPEETVLGTIDAPAA